jgi:hypothetical protein
MERRVDRLGKTSRRAIVALGCLAAGGLVAPRAASAAVHTDAELGYSMQVPGGWKEIPIASEERYIVAKFLCDREYADPKEGWGHTPDLKVILFPKGQKRGATVEKDGDTTRISFTNPYKDYPDYLKSDSSQGGHFISKEEKIVVNGVDTTWYEVTYEKLTVARHVIAFAYHWDDCDYVAQYGEVLETQWKKLSPELITTLKSFKIFPRKGSVKREVTSDDPSGVTILKGDKDKASTAADRAKQRIEKFEQRVRVASERLPEGWKMKRSKNFVAFTHVDMKYTDYVLSQAEALRAWLDEKFGWIGDEYVSSDIIRICASSEERSAFTDTSAKSSWVSEIVMSADGRFYEFRSLNDAVRDRYFRERNVDLAYSMPAWLDRGLDSLISSSYMKGGKLEFRPDLQEVINLKGSARAGTLIPPREIMLATYKPWVPGAAGTPFQPMKPSGDPLDQASGFVRWLVMGPGAKNPRTKDLLKTYFDAIAEVRKESMGKSDAKPDEAPKTEEEEAARFKANQTSWRDNEPERVKQIFDRVFGQWTDADWSAVEKSYQAFVS